MIVLAGVEVCGFSLYSGNKVCSSRYKWHRSRQHTRDVLETAERSQVTPALGVFMAAGLAVGRPPIAE
jgi:hypothetical protein